MKKKYILVDPNNDTGDDNGILDSMELTVEEALKLNAERYERKSDYRWIPLMGNLGIITHLD